jgi:hypothetical protein
MFTNFTLFGTSAAFTRLGTFILALDRVGAAGCGVEKNPLDTVTEELLYLRGRFRLLELHPSHAEILHPLIVFDEGLHYALLELDLQQCLGGKFPVPFIWLARASCGEFGRRDSQDRVIPRGKRRRRVSLKKQVPLTNKS